MTLPEFLLARIAEDEQVAQRVAETWGKGGEWSQAGTAVIGGPFGHVVARPVDVDTPEHIARHDPARVVAECEAKREIVALHSGPQYGRPDAHLCQDSMTDDDSCETLRALAAVYADNPDCREEWK